MEEKIKEAMVEIHNLGGCDSEEDWSQGWDKAIDSAIELLEDKTGISIESLIS